jgi:Trk K+ transport system NAD-binding subunit
MDLDVLGQRRVVAVSRFGVPRIPRTELTIQDGDILHMSVVRSDASSLSEDLKKIGTQ